MEGKRRPSETAIEYIPPEENQHPIGTAEWFLHEFRDLRDKWVDRPDMKKSKADYPVGDSHDVARARFDAYKRNKYNTAWVTAITAHAEEVVALIHHDEGRKEQITRLAAALQRSVDSTQPTPPEQIHDGNELLDLMIEAVEAEQERKQAGQEAA